MTAIAPRKPFVEVGLPWGKQGSEERRAYLREYYRRRKLEPGYVANANARARTHRAEHRDESNARSRERDRQRKLIDPAYAARRAAPPPRTEHRREVERRFEERRRNDPVKVEAKRAARRRHRQRHLEDERRRDRERYQNPERKADVKTNLAARKARLRGARVERVDRRNVLKLTNGFCGICGLAVDPSNYHVDHIVPLARGGEHSYANTQPAHPECNLKKGTSLEVAA